MIAPARNFLPFSSKSSSAAGIFTSAFLKRNVDEVVVGGVLDDERGAGAVDAAGGLHRSGDLRHRLREDALSVTVCSLTLRMNWNVQPVSSYGLGFCGG